MQIQHTDLLGRPIKVGDQVLVKGYMSMTANTVATVLPTKSKQYIKVDLPANSYNYLTRSYEYSTRSFFRYPSDCLVVNELVPISTAIARTYEENLLATPAEALAPTEPITHAQYEKTIRHLEIGKWRYSDYGKIKNPALQDHIEKVITQTKSNYPEYSI